MTVTDKDKNSVNKWQGSGLRESSKQDLIELKVKRIMTLGYVYRFVGGKNDDLPATRNCVNLAIRKLEPLAYDCCQTLEDCPAPANLKADEKPPETAFHSQKVASSPHHHPHVRYGLVAGQYGALNAGAMLGHAFHRRTNVLVCLFSDSPLLSQTCSSRSNVKCATRSFAAPRSSRSHVGTHIPATIILSSLAAVFFLFYLLSFSFLLLASCLLIIACRLLLADSCLLNLACRLLLVDSFLRLFLVCYLLQTRNFLLAIVVLPATCYRLCDNLLACLLSFLSATCYRLLAVNS
ncbi:hypothetical protein Tco_0632437 [Tanacetum coccineum]